MRASSRLAAAAGFLLMLLMTAMEAEAIRMDAESRAAVSRQMVAVNVSVFPPHRFIQCPEISGSVHAVLVVCQKSSDGSVKDGGGESLLVNEAKRSVVPAKDVRATAHRLPEFHEDYYGASAHGPRHH
jgi:hypothetical protein